MTGTASFTWSLPREFEGLGVLPVRLRSPRGGLVANGVSGRAIDVAPGTYLLSITLPDGHEIIAAEPVEIGGSAPPAAPDFGEELFACVPLSSFIPGAPASAPPEIAPAVGPAAQDAPVPPPTGAETPPDAQLEQVAGSYPPQAKALRFQGDWSVIWTEDAAPSVDFGTDVASAEIVLGEQPVRIERGDQPDELLGIAAQVGRRLFVVPFDAAVPRAAGERRSIFAQLKPNGTSLRFTSPVSAETNSFLEFVDQGLLSESARIAHDVFDGFDALKPSMLRIVAAAYVLLRVNQLDAIEAWTAKLLAVAADVPDAHVIRGEALARLGRHEAAIAALQQGYTVGCPWFRSGISHLLERLRFYLEVDAGSSSFGLGPARDQFATWKSRLDRMARRLDTAELYTTFTIE